MDDFFDLYWDERGGGGPSGQTIRNEIDRTIRRFREGNATIQEVLDLIEYYNSNNWQ